MLRLPLSQAVTTVRCSLFYSLLLMSNFKSGVSLPVSVTHKVHVNTDFQWTGEAVFEVEARLGEG
jgi:hypothetical protein